MIHNYIVTALRNILRQKGITLINLLGLAVSMCVTLLLVLYVSHEVSFDTFLKDNNKIYRLVLKTTLPDGKPLIAPLATHSTAYALKSERPEVVDACFLREISPIIRVKEEGFNSITGFVTDTSFANVFSFQIASGDIKQSLAQPGYVVLTETTSNILFGTTNSLYNELEMDDKTYKVGAILSDIPSNSHLRFSILFSTVNIEDKETYLDYGGVSYAVYFKTHKPINNPTDLAPIAETAERVANERLKETGIKVHLWAQPLLDIHLNSADFSFDVDGTGSKSRIGIIAILVLFIITIAIMNFANLMVARSHTRLKEIGLRKVCGASKIHIAAQFIGEAIIISLFSMLIAATLAELLLPAFNTLVERDLSLTVFDVRSGIILLTLSVTLGIIAGVVPAVKLSSITTQTALKGEQKKGKGLSRMQISLVIIQFTIAVFLISSIINLTRQLNYVKSKNLGFASETYIVHNLNSNLKRNYSTLKDIMVKIPGVVSVSGSQSVPGNQSTMQNCYIDGSSPETSIMIQHNRVQDGYLTAMQIPVIEGRDFNLALASDSTSFILNQAAVKALGLTNPIGTTIHVWDLKGTVIGVTPDYHSNSLHQAISPLVLSRDSKFISYLIISVKKETFGTTTKAIQEKIGEYDGSYIFKANPINSFFAGEYRREEKLNTMIISSAILAILISIMGLFALTYFTTSRRTKEIGIRKALGASKHTLLNTLVWDISKWVVLVNIIAWPAAYFAMELYLKNFAYHVNQQLWVYVASGAIAMVISVSTILGHTLKTAAQNPIRALRYE
ncbi:MAG: FtsX-like permease family protein [Tenuifilaceae bacterium]|jgi:ABC-type antimicrobial peptide transport system permease subunit|nr:FtsX-like permease family protein [Tenuifilaceae bacterium]